MTRGPVETSERPEVAVLFGCVNGQPAWSEPLSELEGLAEAADVGVAGRLVQRLDRPTAATYIGKGKVGELAALIASTQADLAIADMDLSPAQARNLSQALGVRVVDRSELIMDIFARRARTAQAQLQVELAQLQYALPRLRGQWSHLDRYKGGGVGTRGPGEKQIETDKRLVLKRIKDLKERLEVWEQRTRRSVASRAGTHQIALAGYTNSGKSTLFNALTGAGVLTANRLFATLDTRTRRWPIEDMGPVLLSDTVGFVRDLPHHLVASFHATLEEVVEADLVLHVVDASSPEAREQVRAVHEVMEQIGAGRVPARVLLNKCDAVRDPMDLQALRNAEPDAIPISARTGQGLADVEDLVRQHFAGALRRFRVLVPHAEGRAQAQAHALALVEAMDILEEGLLLHLAVGPGRIDRLRGWAESRGLKLEPDDEPSREGARLSATRAPGPSAGGLRRRAR